MRWTIQTGRRRSRQSSPTGNALWRGRVGEQSGVSQRRRAVAVSPQYAYNKLLIRSEAGGRHLSNGKRELGEIPSSVVLRLSARAEQGVCLSALDEGDVSSWERRRPSRPSVLDSVRRVLGIPNSSCSSLSSRQVWLRRRHCSPGSAIVIGDWTLPGWKKGHELMCDGAPVAKQREGEAMLPMSPGVIFMRCHGGRSSDGVFDVREASL